MNPILFLQKVTVLIGDPMDFTAQLKELRAANKSAVSIFDLIRAVPYKNTHIQHLSLP